jgi:hypothetical protein
MLEYGEGAVPGAVTAEGVGVRMLYDFIHKNYC